MRRWITFFGGSAWRDFREAKRWLRDRRYTVVRDEGDPTHSAVAELRRDPTSITLGHDRGAWFVDVRPGDVALRAYPLDMWAIALGTEAPAFSDDPIDSVRDFKARLAYLHRHLSEIEAACAADRAEGTLTKLREADRTLAARSRDKLLSSQAPKTEA